MAKIQEKIWIIKISMLIKDDDINEQIEIPDKFKQTLESTIQKLVDDNLIVEIEEA